MADKKGNIGVIAAVTGVLVVTGVVLYLLSRKTKKIDETLIGRTAGGAPVISNTDPGVTLATEPYVPGQSSTKPVDWSAILSGILGSGKSGATAGLQESSSHSSDEHDEPTRTHAEHLNWVKG